MSGGNGGVLAGGGELHFSASGIMCRFEMRTLNLVRGHGLRCEVAEVASTAREIKNIFATGAKKPCCATGFESNRKSSAVPGRSCHLCKEKRVLQITSSNADSGAQLKVRILPSGLNK